ncbi:DUF6457 domain-containing protein [Agromyces endophyticus]|uniref:DUF6457 domain-containing protein n=1 Tax=Agromyces sp. H17E-10 TaxID=2932244 RepID=UPI001FD060E5|nr:DUF6457 domain-containing protein [Agromyces sp. H17E-10]UOQ87885.1 DUF6457 domain-containing protein [Agromyces sp. H17E-10]
MTANDDDLDRTIEEWGDRVRAELGVPDAPLDVNAVLGVAGVAAHAIVRPAAPVTTYLAGYAAGLAVGRGAEPEAAAREALEHVRRLASS